MKTQHNQKKKKKHKQKKPTILVESVFWADCSFQTWGPQRPSYLGDLLAVKSHIKEREAHNSCFQRLRRKTTFTCETTSTTLDDAGLESKNNWEERGQCEQKLTDPGHSLCFPPLKPPRSWKQFASWLYVPVTNVACLPTELDIWLPCCASIWPKLLLTWVLIWKMQIGLSFICLRQQATCEEIKNNLRQPEQTETKNKT